MSKTNSIFINTSEILDKLKVFSDLEQNLETIEKLTDLNDKLLIPVDFYDGVNLELGSDYSSHGDDFVNTISKINKYIKGIEMANIRGNGINKEDLLTEQNRVSESNINIGHNTLNEPTNDLGMVSDTIINASNTSFNTIDMNNNGVNGISNNGNNWNISNNNQVFSDLNNIDEINGHQIIDKILDNSGKVIAVSIIADGKKIWYRLNNQDIVSAIDTINGNEIIDKIYDTTGKVIAVSVIADGKKIWYQIINNNVIIPIDSTNGTYYLNEVLEIIVDGKKVQISAGNYQIDQIMCYEDGKVKSIRLLHNNYKIWIHFTPDGNISKVNYIKTQNGVFVINNPDYDIYDMYGNVIGKFTAGNYYIYDVLYDNQGKVVAFRLSPDGEYEKWLYLNDNTSDGSYSLFDNNQNNGKTSLSLFEKNKGLFGLLGILFVALGVTVVLKKKESKKDQMNYTNNYDDYYNSSESNASNNYQYNNWQEEKLPTGNYGVYDVRRDDEGNIYEARINPVDEDDEYWVEV